MLAGARLPVRASRRACASSWAVLTCAAGSTSAQTITCRVSKSVQPLAPRSARSRGIRSTWSPSDSAFLARSSHSLPALRLPAASHAAAWGASCVLDTSPTLAGTTLTIRRRSRARRLRSAARRASRSSGENSRWWVGAGPAATRWVVVVRTGVVSMPGRLRERGWSRGAVSGRGPFSSGCRSPTSGSVASPRNPERSASDERGGAAGAAARAGSGPPRSRRATSRCQLAVRILMCGRFPGRGDGLSASEAGLADTVSHDVGRYVAVRLSETVSAEGASSLLFGHEDSPRSSVE